MISARIYKSSKILTATVAATLALTLGSNVLAKDRDDDDRGGHQQQRHGDRDDRHGHGKDKHKDKHADKRYDRDNDQYSRRQDFREGRQFDRDGFPQPHVEWRRGGRVPVEYRSRTYVVNDWRQYQLQAPPRGYQYVSVGGDYVLAAIATGIIANIIIGGR